MIDEPTRGVDIGAKQQIYRFIAALAAEGRSVIVISSEMAELIGLCHRIVVMRGGRIVGEVEGEAMNEHEIVVMATGVDAQAGECHGMSAATQEAKAPARRRFELGAIAPFLALALLCVLGESVNSRFVSVDNLTNVLARSTFIATIAVGQTLVITGGGLDLSVGSMAALVAGLEILFLNSGLIDNPTLLVVCAMALSLGVGALCGLFNGLTTTLGKIEPFIVTLGTMGIFRSLLTWLAQGGSITITQQRRARGLSRSLFRRHFRRALSGAGDRRRRRHRRLHPLPHRLRKARARGWAPTRTWRAIPASMSRGCAPSLTCCKGCASASRSIVYVPRLSSASSTTGLGWELVAITAVVVGGTRLKGGVGRVWGTIAGALILEAIGNIMLLSNLVSEYLIGAVQGAIIIIAMLAQRMARGR